MKNSIIILLTVFLIGCKKEIIMPVDCQPVWLVSEKYSQQNDYIRTDTLWLDLNLCGRWLDSVRLQKDQWYLDCNSMLIEHWYYIVGNK